MPLRNISRFTGLIFLSSALIFAGCGKKEEARKAAAAPILPQFGFTAASPPVPGIDVTADFLALAFAADSTRMAAAASAWAPRVKRTGQIVPTLAVHPREALSGSTVQRTVGGKAVQAAGRRLLFPDSLSLVAALRRIQRCPASASVIVNAPVFGPGAGYSSAFRKRFSETAGRPWTDPADSAQAWWAVARAKQSILDAWLRRLLARVRANPKTGGRNILLRSPGLLSAAAAAEIIPDRRARGLPELNGLIGRLPGAERIPPFTYQGRREQRPFAWTWLAGSWWLNTAAPGQEVWLELAGPPSSGAWQKAAVAALFQPGLHRVLLDSLPGRLPAADVERLGTFAFLTGRLAAFPPGNVRWRGYPWPRTGVLISDTYTWTRGAPWRCDLESFFELALALLNHGVPVEAVPLERIGEKHFLDRYGVLLATFEGFKPENGSFLPPLERWIRRGGMLVFYLGLTGPFDEVSAWWSQQFDRPHEPLFDRLGIGLYPESGMHKIGQGVVYTDLTSPAELATMPQSGEIIWNSFLEMLQFVRPDSARFQTQPFLVQDRGPYRLVWNPDEVPSPRTFQFSGHWLNALQEGFPLTENAAVLPGQAGIFFNLDALPPDTAVVCLSSAPVTQVHADSLQMNFAVQWATHVPVHIALCVPNKPAEISVRTEAGDSVPIKIRWNADRRLLRLEFTSTGEALRIRLAFRR